MTPLSKLSAAIFTLVVLIFSGKSNAQATEGTGLNNWQPCPNSLANPSGESPANQWNLTVSPYTHHWRSSTEHKPVRLVALDSHEAGGRFCGLALFTNSFGQDSAYAYVGQQWDGLWGNPKLFIKVSAGVLYGYRDAYKDKLAFNHAGIAPVIIPALGYTISHQDSVQAFFLGTAGVLFAYTHGF